MPNWQGTIFFGLGSRGWSEVWYSGTYNDSAGALASLVRVAQVRATALAQQAVLRAARVSDVAVRGDSRVWFNDAVVAASVMQNAGDADIPGSVWYVQAIGNDFSRRQVMLRGMPDNWFDLPAGVKDPDVVAPDPQAIAFVKAYAKVLKDERWGLLGTDPASAAGTVPIDDITRDPVSEVIILNCQAGVGVLPLPFDLVRIYRPRITPPIASLQRVLSVAGSAVTLFATSAVPLVYKGGSSLRRLNKTVITVLNLQIVRAARRRTGRAFFVPRGRAPRRK